VIDVSVSVTDRDSDWSKQWDFGLPVEADPFTSGFCTQSGA